MTRPSRVLITGATGYVGRSLSKYLIDSAYEVIPFVRKSINHPHEIVYNGSADSITQGLQKQQPEIIVHLASHISVGESWEDINSFLDSNMRLTNYLLKAAVEANIYKFINAGSFFQYSRGNSAFSPNSLYACYKQSTMDLLEYYCQQRGLSANTLILYDVYGPNDNRKKLINLLLKQSHVETTKAQQWMYFTHIDDVVRGIEISFHNFKTSTHQVYSLADRPAVKLVDVIDSIMQLRKGSLSVEIGAKDYPEHIIYNPYVGEKLPDWSEERDINQFLKEMIHGK